MLADRVVEGGEGGRGDASTATIVLLKRDERYEIAAFDNTLITG